MFIRNLNECAEIIAGDACRLRELLHPDKADIQIRYSLAHAFVDPGQITKPHKLTGASEVYYILRGRGVMEIDGERREVGPGAAIYIPPDAEQCIHNTGKEVLEFICLVDPPWRPELEVVKKARD